MAVLHLKIHARSVDRMRFLGRSAGCGLSFHSPPSASDGSFSNRLGYKSYFSSPL